MPATKSKPSSDQAGFTLASIMVVMVIAAAGYLGYRFVVNAQKDNKTKGASFQEAIYGEKYDSNDVDNKEPEDLEAPEVSKEYPIRSVSVDTDIYHVFLNAKLPGTFTGYCRAEVTQGGLSELRRYEEKITNKSSCKITIPREKLAPGEWNYLMSFETFDGKSWGKHEGSTFKL